MFVLSSLFYRQYSTPTSMREMSEHFRFSSESRTFVDCYKEPQVIDRPLLSQGCKSILFKYLLLLTGPYHMAGVVCRSKQREHKKENNKNKSATFLTINGL